MADSIVSGLFGPTPYQLQQQRLAQQEAAANAYAAQDPFQRAEAGFYRAGGQLADIGAGMLGLERPEMVQARQQQAIMQQGGLDTPEKIRAMAERFRQSGDMQRAYALGQLANQEEAKAQELATKKAQEGLYSAQAAKAARDEKNEEPAMKYADPFTKLIMAREAAVKSGNTAAVRFYDRKIAQETQLKSETDGRSQKTQVITDSSGNSVLINSETGDVIKELGAIGKQSATFEKTKVAEKITKQNIDTAIKNLEDATKDGGLIDKSTGSGAGALVDISAGFFGKATPGAIAVGEMRPIYDLVLKMVPRFEGPQSDKDTTSYEKAAGQLANPNVPNVQKKAAGKVILKLMKERKSQFIDKSLEGTEVDVQKASENSDSSRVEEWVRDSKGKLVRKQ